MYCTVDLGSTKTEIVLFGKDLRPLRSEGFPTLFVREEGTVFLEPKAYGEEIFRCLAKLLATPRNKPSQMEDFFCTITGMGSTILAADRQRRVVVPSLSWGFRIPGGAIGEYPLARTGKLKLICILRGGLRISTYPLQRN